MTLKQYRVTIGSTKTTLQLDDADAARHKGAVLVTADAPEAATKPAKKASPKPANKAAATEPENK